MPFEASSTALGPAPALIDVSKRKVAAWAGLAVTGLVSTWLGGCASRGIERGPGPAPNTGSTPSNSGSTAATPSPPSPAESKAVPPPDALVPERKYLSDWFAGTPVLIDFERDGALRVEVPLQHAFDARQTKVKPALFKVLDRVATSLRRVPNARAVVTAPGDPNPPIDAALADTRVKSVREAIVSRGVNAIRVSGAAPSNTGMVQIRIVMAELKG